jgi:transposase
MASQSSRLFAKRGHSRKTVRQVIRGARADVFRSRMNSLEPYLLLLDSHWAAGCSNSAELWRRLKADGFGGSPRVVSEWATRRRRTECVTEGQLRKVPSARTILFCSPRPLRTGCRLLRRAYSRPCLRSPAISSGSSRPEWSIFCSSQSRLVEQGLRTRAFYSGERCFGRR